MRLTTGTVIAVAAAFILGGAVAALAVFGRDALPLGHPTPAGKPTWTEVAWPFQLDEWGKGKAFHCKAADCGAEVNIYIRAKIGFCNCLTGVSDDNELDRLSDFGLMGDRLSVLGPGHEINVAWMKGRSRPYAIDEPYHAPNSALAIAFNDRCDAIVATAVVAHDRPKTMEASVIDFLNSEVVVHWAEVTLGL